MTSLPRHILTIGRVLLFLFFLANSGFTIALHHCTMANAAASDSQGDGSDECGTCCDVQVPRHGKAVQVLVGQPCRTIEVAGGLHTDPTVAETESNLRQLVKVDLLPTSITGLVVASQIDQPICIPATTASNVFPPSVEKYVLNGNFLI